VLVPLSLLLGNEYVGRLLSSDVCTSGTTKETLGQTGLPNLGIFL